jgi:hypothetical protein
MHSLTAPPYASRALFLVYGGVVRVVFRRMRSSLASESSEFD